MRTNILAAFAAVLLLAGAGCGAPKPESAAPETPQAAAPLAGLACPYDDKELCRFMMNWKEAPSFKAKTVTTAPGEARMEADMEQADGGKRMRMVARQGGKVVSEFISIDGTTYMWDPEAEVWWRFAAQQEDPTAAALPEIEVEYSDDGEIVKDETRYERQGKEPCGNATCFKYKVYDPATPKDVQYLWFDDRDYQLRKMRTESADGSVYEMTIDYVKVDVAPPTGTIKDFPSFAPPSGSGSPDGMPSDAELERYMQDAERMMQESGYEE